jgi:hypothetical protein
MRFKTGEEGLLLVSAVAGTYVNAGDRDGRIRSSAELDGARLPGAMTATAPLSGAGQASYSSSATLRRGKHVLRLKASVTSSDTQVGVSSLSLHATVLPHADAR